MASFIGKLMQRQELPELRRPMEEEAQVAFLKSYDFFVLIDQSGSMSEIEDKKQGITRWDIVKEHLKVIVGYAAELDSDGIDVCFFSSTTQWHENIESSAKVDRLFKESKPNGSTNLAEALEEVFAMHFKKCKQNSDQKSIVLVITDGEPDDERKVSNSIVSATRHLAKKHLFKWTNGSVKTTELGVRFFQVGSSKKAEAYLKKLDDSLTEAKADIVDTGNIEELESESSVREALINAIFD